MRSADAVRPVSAHGAGGEAPTIVSITPLRVEADSRTFKQAASAARLGYVSIVMEGQASRLSAGQLPFDLRPIMPAGLPASATHAEGDGGPGAVTPGRGGQLHGKVRRLLEALRLTGPLRFVAAVARYLNSYVVRPLRRTPRASLYYLHAFYQFPAVYLLCLRHRARFVYDAHDFYPDLNTIDPSSFSARWIAPFEVRLERWCVQKAAAVVTVNEGIAGLMEQRFGRRPLVVRNVHDGRLDRKPAETLRERLGLGADVVLVVAVGNAKPGMAIDELVEALTALPSRVHCAFVGAGYDAGRLTRASGGRVHVVAPVAPDEVVPFIATADAAVVLYYAKSLDYLYSLPNRFFQAIAAELPLLYPDLPEMRRLVERYDIGLLIDPRSPASIADGLRRLLEDADLARRLRANLAGARHELAWEREEPILAALFAELLGGRRAT